MLPKTRNPGRLRAMGRDADWLQTDQSQLVFRWHELLRFHPRDFGPSRSHRPPARRVPRNNGSLRLEPGRILSNDEQLNQTFKMSLSSGLSSGMNKFPRTPRK